MPTLSNIKLGCGEIMLCVLSQEEKDSGMVNCPVRSQGKRHGPEPFEILSQKEVS